MEWINKMGMTGLPGTFANQRLDWKPGSHDLIWDRTITAIDTQSNMVEIDAPVTTAMEQKQVNPLKLPAMPFPNKSASRISFSKVAMMRPAPRMRTTRGSRSCWTMSKTRGCVM